MLAFLSQLLSYSILTWGCFIAITFIGTRYGKWLGLIASQISIAVMILYLDIRWVIEQSKMPAWDGTPDLDIVFDLGVLQRILLINTVLLPIAFYAFARRRNQRIVQGEVTKPSAS